MNLVLWSKGSSGAVPFSTLIALLALWFCVSVPLTFVGAYFGFRRRVSFFFKIFIVKVIICFPILRNSLIHLLLSPLNSIELLSI